MLLSESIPWRIVIEGGAAEVVVAGINLTGLEITGGFNAIRIDLPAPATVVPIRISGGASEIAVRRPQGVGVRLKIKGWISQLVLDEQTINGAGNNLQLHCPSLEPVTSYYDLEIKSYANSVAITAG